MKFARRTSRPLATAAAFTLVELLVVISIIALVAAALVPAFARLVESNNYAAAVNTVSATLGSARTTAVQTGRSAGVVFLWDAQREVTTLVLVTQGAEDLGVLTSRASAGGSQRYAQMMSPIPLTAPVELPRGMGVFGLSFALDVTRVPPDIAWNRPIENDPAVAKWYAGEMINIDTVSEADDIRLWLSPRDDARLFTAADRSGNLGQDPWLVIRGVNPNPNSPLPIIDIEAANLAVRHANTFFVLFGPDGSLVTPKRSGGDNIYDYYLEYPDGPMDPQSTVTPPRPYDDNGRFDPENVGGLPRNPDRVQVNAELVMRAAEQIAIVDIAKLAEGSGVPRPWLVRAATSRAPQPQWLTAGGWVNNDRARRVSRWIDNNAEIITFNRYTGNAIRRNAS